MFLKLSCKKLSKIQNYYRKIKINQIQMKNTITQNYFVLTSPQDQLKQISLGDLIEEASFQSPRPTKKLIQKYAIGSWDISHKLKPFQNQNQRYKQMFSTNLSAKTNSRRFRAKSAFLTKRFQNTNDHNFNIKRKSTIDISTQRKQSNSFFRPFKQIQKATISIILSKSVQKSPNKMCRSKNKIQRQLKADREARIKTIESYLTHQKQIINRQKQLLITQRIGRQGIKFLVYPTQYWKEISQSSPVKKSRKKTINITNKMIQTANPQVILNQNKSPVSKISKNCNKQQPQISTSCNSQSPIKRFRNFKEKMRNISFH